MMSQKNVCEGGKVCRICDHGIKIIIANLYLAEFENVFLRRGKIRVPG